MDSYTEADALAVAKRLSVADDEDVALVIEYFGPESGCEVTVDATTGDISSEAPVGTTDTSFLEPGGTGGNIDVSDALADTLGELVNVINAIPYYRAYLVDALPTDSANDTLLAMAATQCKVTGGLKLMKDTSVALNIAVAISGENFDYMDDGCKNEVDYIAGFNTFGSGDSYIKVYEGTTLKHTFPLMTTATLQEYDSTKVNFGVKGKKLLIVMIGSAACTGYLIVQKKTTRLVPMHKTSMA